MFQWDFVVTVCGHAHEACPFFPDNARVVHVGFDDAPALVKSEATEVKAMAPNAACAMRSAHLSRPCLNRFRNSPQLEQIEK
jgi:protein-tyrosine-phosphatase